MRDIVSERERKKERRIVIEREKKERRIVREREKERGR